ncbi:hypothetical protein AN640_00365 [Candidatus Epulonipiscium fishelsonii]|uniref:Uncharacterized protein n=1 Tax=Candidatus Epulonipiscium fishelsonii TaxID=77094 RepID=A0ACC8XBI3_9FIRM|nr:hypothetical protein AN640_00365 [Epulopiscium sp. SCG-D08WGA-EpuloA1]
MIVELEQAIEIINKNIKIKDETEIIDIDEIENRILAKDIYAKINQPPFNRSPLDGYAVNSSDIQTASKNTPVKLKVIGSIYAGDDNNIIGEIATAVRIMTGGSIPSGYDCIIRQEDTDYGDKEVQIYVKHTSYQNYCFKGEDIKEGELLLKKGTLLNFVHVGILASQGISKINVKSKTNILFLTTGDELINIGDKLTSGKIYNTNLYTLKSRLKCLGVNVVAKTFKDDEIELAKYIKENHKFYDAIITTGGVSVGAKDIIHDTQKELFITPIFNKVNLKPGTPAMFWKYSETPILSLSGNPFAAVVTFELMARAMISLIGENVSIMPIWINGTMADKFEKASNKRRFIRAFYHNGIVNIKVNNHSSGAFTDTAYCNCLIDIEAGNKGLNKGDKVKLILF